MDSIRFDKRVAVVTGAGRGLGKAYALELARRGASVVVNDLAGAQDVVDEITAIGGQATASTASVATEQGGAEIVDEALDAFGAVDIVINNAGIVRDRSLAKLSHQELEDVLDVNLRGAFHVTVPAFRHMKERGYGRLLYITSASGLFGNFGQANYSAAKMGLVGLAATVAIEGARYGIQSNALSPLAHTSMTEGMFGGAVDSFATSEVVPIAVYLVSEACRLTHEVFSAGGGRFARVVVGVTRGWAGAGDMTTVEDVHEHLDDICDPGGLTTPKSLSDEIDIARAMLG